MNYSLNIFGCVRNFLRKILPIKIQQWKKRESEFNIKNYRENSSLSIVIATLANELQSSINHLNLDIFYAYHTFLNNVSFVYFLLSLYFYTFCGLLFYNVWFCPPPILWILRGVTFFIALSYKTGTPSTDWELYWLYLNM